MKKLLALLLALAMVMSLAACGGGAQDETPETKAPAANQGEQAPADEGGDAVETVKIGLVFPITGGNADQGVFNVDGAKYIVV